MIEMLDYYKDLVKLDNCVQIFTNESAIPFFLNKPTCSKYYSMTMAVSDENQNQFINDLIENKPKIILFDTEESLLDVRLHDTKNRLPKVSNYIKSNYTFHSKFKSWTFVRLK